MDVCDEHQVCERFMAKAIASLSERITISQGHLKELIIKQQIQIEQLMKETEQLRAQLLLGMKDVTDAQADVNRDLWKHIGVLRWFVLIGVGGVMALRLFYFNK